MMNFKSHNMQSGMTFIEVVLAVFIIGSLLSSILLLQSSVMRSLYIVTAKSERMFLLKNYLANVMMSREKKEKEIEKTKKIDDPATTITLEENKPPKNSALKNFESIKIVKVTALWEEWETKKKESMITFLFSPEKKEA